MGAHEKFTNYSFNVDEFMRLIGEASEYVFSHPRFIEEQRKKYGDGHTSDRTAEKSDLWWHATLYVL